jgi:hypothetical protein
MKKTFLTLLFSAISFLAFCQPPIKPALGNLKSLPQSNNTANYSLVLPATSTITIGNYVFNQLDPSSYVRTSASMPQYQTVSKVGNYWIYTTQPTQYGQTFFTQRTSATNYPNKPPCNGSWERSQNTYGPFVPSGNLNTIVITGNCQ